MAHATERFEGVSFAAAPDEASLAEDVVSGLRQTPQATLPARLLYDDRGCELFDRICDLPEYYPTRTERALLERVAPDIAARTGARELIELGSGMARKTEVLLDALTARHTEGLRYVPFDVSASAVRSSIERLLQRYPRLRAHGVVGDFTRHLRAIPAGQRRLVAFLGGTFGNLEPEGARAFVGEIAALLGPEDHFLLAADLIKETRLLHAAYNDADGITAAFNLNAIRRLRVELGFELDSGAFGHEAFFNEDASQIEMHVRARVTTRITSAALGFDRVCEAGGSLRTEISRKFSVETLAGLIASAGMQVCDVYRHEPPYALVLARRAA